MIIEVLLALPVVNKTFFYKSSFANKNNLRIGQIVKVTFRKKEFFGIIISFPKEINIKKELIEIEKSYENYFFNKEIIDSISFLSRYTCNSRSSILKSFLSGFKETQKKNEITPLKYNLKYPPLSTEQKKAVSQIKKKGEFFKVISLNGITGSGKTRVYMYVVKEKLNKKKQCLILVPEKILTNEWISEIFNDFGIKAHVYHSSVRQSKRNEIWNQVILNKPLLLIGTRSSLFLPFKNLGIIIVDEEHDQSYKQEEKLILNSRDFAVVRAKNSNCPIILSSATPSIETIHNCQKQKFEEIKIKKRINNIPLPTIKIIDMRNEKSLISNQLISEIKLNLKNKDQTMIFINKRGYTSFTLCKSCGFVKLCPNCNVSLVLHNFLNEEKSFLLCHHCSYTEKFYNFCKECNTDGSISFPGEGIEKIYEEVQKNFPNSKNVFISSDTVKDSNNQKLELSKIIENKFDIIVGTQILSKGHNFPYLKTVGIINIDNLLNDFDFRSFEKCFQQIIQVSGRAGRINQQGNVLIQSIQPEHEVLKYCKNYSFENFYENELKRRKTNNQPPFTNLISLIISSTNNNKALNFSILISKNLKKQFQSILIYGPAPSVISLKNKKFRHRILLKLQKQKQRQDIIKNYLRKIKVPNEVKLYIDVDPLSFL